MTLANYQAALTYGAQKVGGKLSLCEVWYG